MTTKLLSNSGPQRPSSATSGLRWGFGDVRTSTRVWVTIFSEETRVASLRATATLRAAGIPSEISLEGGKMGRQLKAADARGVPYALVLGPDEVSSGQALLKDLRSGEQLRASLDEIVARLR